MDEYIAQFDELLMRCGVDEDLKVTLSRFKAGLRGDIQRKLFLLHVLTLEQAYQLAQDVERKTPIFTATNSSSSS